MSFIESSHRLAAETVIKKFEKRNMEAFYCATKEEAKNLVLSFIPEGSSVTWGGTESMKEAGICDVLSTGNYNFIDRRDAKTPEEARALYGKIVCADYFLTSTNAFTKDGELVNIDGASNRVACIAHGPANVIVLASMDKMCSTVRRMYRVHPYPCSSSKRSSCRSRYSMYQNRRLRRLHLPILHLLPDPHHPLFQNPRKN